MLGQLIGGEWLALNVISGNSIGVFLTSNSVGSILASKAILSA